MDVPSIKRSAARVSGQESRGVVAACCSKDSPYPLLSHEEARLCCHRTATRHRGYSCQENNSGLHGRSSPPGCSRLRMKREDDERSTYVTLHSDFYSVKVIFGEDRDKSFHRNYRDLR
ncbi:unnamed protein product [Cuscuta europaea]|uniref:Uncharacterized protein n=1 Tax=Cuscuta europaea TaxID=41803 RepID=A0A9P1EL12_CUSEU|nr:unnamed protein product [Cuscuta europaea]